MNRSHRKASRSASVPRAARAMSGGGLRIPTASAAGIVEPKSGGREAPADDGGVCLRWRARDASGSREGADGRGMRPPGMAVRVANTARTAREHLAARRASASAVPTGLICGWLRAFGHLRPCELDTERVIRNRSPHVRGVRTRAAREQLGRSGARQLRPAARETRGRRGS